MNKFLIVFVCLISLFFLTVTVAYGIDEFIEYRDDTLGFSVNYPTDWTFSEASDGVTFISPDSTEVSLSSLNVFIYDNTTYTGNSIKDVLSQELQILKNDMAANIHQVKEIKMDNIKQPAYAILYISKIPMLGLDAMSFETIFFDEKSSKTYILGYTATQDKFKRDIEMLQRSIKTFQIISPQNDIFDLCINDPTSKNCVRDSSEDLISKFLGEDSQSEIQNETTDITGSNQVRSQFLVLS